MSHALQFLVLTMAGLLNRQQEDLIDYLREENRVLRELLGSGPLRLSDAQRRRLAVRGKRLGPQALTGVAGIVTPDTILRRYRKLIAKKYDGSVRRTPGRPMTPRKIAELVVRMAVENPKWGYTRIRAALGNIGHEIARNTVKRILQDHGIEPAPERGRRLPWKTFLQAHWEGLAATDLFTVEVLTLAGLRRYFVFFVIELKTRRVKIAGIHHQPYGKWMEQMARNLSDVFDGFLRNSRHLIHDRDPLYTRAFGEILKSSGVQPIRLPPRSPNLNAYAERFVRSIKEECLNRVVLLGESHLRLIVHEYVEHYHRERNHQGLDNQLLERAPPPANQDAGVQRRKRIGGLLNYYHREAA
jgi:putative transposase